MKQTSAIADASEDEDYDESEVEDGKIELPTYAVFCFNCEARGPVKKNRNEAMYYWNNKFS